MTPLDLVMVGCVDREWRASYALLGESNIQASEKEISRVHVQYGELPWLDSQHRKQGKADNEACGCREIESTEDQQSIPPAHCGGKRISIVSCSREGERLYSQFKLDGSVHEANACDDNGCAGTWSVLLALVAKARVWHRNEEKGTHVQTSLLPLLAGLEQAVGHPGPHCA